MNFTNEQLRAKGYVVENGIKARLRTKPQPSDRKGLSSLARTQSEVFATSERLDISKSKCCLTVESFACFPFDADNLAGGCKAVIDALRYEGIIPQDDPDHLQLLIKSSKVHEKKHERLELTLEIINT